MNDRDLKETSIGDRILNEKEKTKKMCA